MRKISRSTAESRARKALGLGIARELRVLKLLGELTRHVAEDQDSRDAPYAKALTVLFGRVADDLRAIEWLLHSGYPLQAWALAATIHEVAYTAGFIGGDDAKAIHWRDWPTFTKTPWSAEEVEAGTLKRIGLESRPRTPGTYTFYTVLCLAKHPSPHTHKGLVVSLSPEAHLLNSDPSFSPQRLIQALAITYLATFPVIRALLAIRADKLLSKASERRFLRVATEWQLVADEWERTRPGSNDRAT